MTDLEKLKEWMRGDESAVALNRALHQVVEVWDDLIDRDVNVTPDAINEAFYLLLISIPRNAFYQSNHHVLSPIIEAAILDWHAANNLESRKHDMETAYGLRSTGQMVTIMSARIIGGFEWAKRVNIEMRESGEKYADYIREFE